MSQDSELATTKAELDQLESINLFQRDSKQNEKIYQLKAILQEIIKEYKC